MKNIDYTLRARLQLLGIVAVIAVFAIILVSKFGCSSNSSDTKVEKKTGKSVKTKTLSSIPEPRFLKKSELIPFMQQLSWAKAKSNNIKFPRIANYPTAGILIDLNTNEVIWAKNPEMQVPIASMSKLMTVLLVLEEIKYGNKNITLDSQVKATRECAAIRVGAMGLSPNKIYKLEELLQAATIRSANDAAALAGAFIADYSVAEFVKKMNLKAQSLQLKKTIFINPHGLPDKNKHNLSTALEVAVMANEILRHPEYMKWAKTYQTFAVNNTKELTNTNNLVRKRKTPGVDGLKTGYTIKAGSCLAFSCMRDGRRMLGVVTGFKRAGDRDDFVEALLDWGYKQ
ncbi:MAG: D-alanyl-D-alanine carboxypeptidase [Lentisphaeria bacterium]|nr:D-alanyl-D-alanine carboxypeptidase [Lentisphaeria bacterium]